VFVFVVTIRTVTGCCPISRLQTPSLTSPPQSSHNTGPGQMIAIAAMLTRTHTNKPKMNPKSTAAPAEQTPHACTHTHAYPKPQNISKQYSTHPK